MTLVWQHWPVAFAPKGDLKSNLFPQSGVEKNGVKQVDLDLKTSLVDTWKAMIKLVETGKVKSVGVSNFSIAAVSPPSLNISKEILRDTDNTRFVSSVVLSLPVQDRSHHRCYRCYSCCSSN